MVCVLFFAMCTQRLQYTHARSSHDRCTSTTTSCTACASLYYRYPPTSHTPQTCLTRRAELSHVVVACADDLRGVFSVHVLLLLRVRLCLRHLFQRELLNPPVLLNLLKQVWGIDSYLTRLSAALGFCGRPCDELLVAVRCATHITT